MLKLHTAPVVAVVFLAACASPTVVQTVKPGDTGLSCAQLQNEYADTERFRSEADKEKGMTGGNVARALLFWPAILGSFSNANEAIAAADSRKVHLANLMSSKNCPLPGQFMQVQPTAPATATAPGTESPKPTIAGLPRAGATWIYSFSDKLYGQNTTSFTVRMFRADDQIVQEHLSTGLGATRTPEAQRAIDAHKTRFIEHPVGASAVLREFAPYYLVAIGEGAPTLVIDAAGYPTGGFSNWITESRPPTWEQVTIPAGTFNALRLEISGRRQQSTTSILATDRFSVRVWYAPEVKRYVRLEHKEWRMQKLDTDVVVELVKFSLAS